MISFGLLSDILSLIQFKLPNNEDVYSDLREIPLFIGILYLRNPLLITLACIFSPLTYLVGVPYLPTVVMHIFPLLIIAWVYKKMNLENDSRSLVLTKWLVICLFYYFIMLFPSSVITYQIFDLDKGQPLLDAYLALTKTSLYEITATTLVTILYVIQFETNKSLVYTNQNLEKIVEDRTLELLQANKDLLAVNEELTASNEEVNSLNDNLERIVVDRTDKIKAQLNQLTKYAHMNSHEVRAPLARILGLVILIKNEGNQDVASQLFEKLAVESENLDVVIKKMNRLLEHEIE
jgi:signal transduction histidine kinase